MSNIAVFKNEELLAQAAAEFFIKLAAQAFEEDRKFTVALSGGNTPNLLYALLAKNEFAEKINWKNVYFFWGDERCVPLTDKNNNSFNTKNIFLNYISVPKENIFVIPVDERPVNAAIYYESTLKIFFKSDMPSFDLILLGLGTNGHTASLFPNTDILDETNILVKAVYVDELKMERVSFTLPLINHAKNILFLIAGKEKAEITQKIINGKVDPINYPAQFIHPKNGQLYFYLDEQSASMLS